jgi:hypothetical protein
MPSNKILMIDLRKTVQGVQRKVLSFYLDSQKLCCYIILPVRNNVRINAIIDDFNLEGSDYYYGSQSLIK